MTIVVLSHMCVNENVPVEGYTKLLPIVEETRSFGGCLRAELLVGDADAARLVLLVEWDSEDSYAKYRTWRAEQGVAELLALLAEPSVLSHYTPV